MSDHEQDQSAQQWRRLGFSDYSIKHNEKASLPDLTDPNGWADFWRYGIGVNVIPADTQNKRTHILWSEFQDRPISKAQHDQWKLENAFSKGMAIVPGRLWHNKLKLGFYFTCLDLDKQVALEEICKINGKATLDEVAAKYLVEQHRDNTTKAHIAFYSPVPFPKKSADSKTGIEVKGLGEHGIICCSPSVHKDGQRYEIIGTTD
jgi:hypothetical protein